MRPSRRCVVACVFFAIVSGAPGDVVMNYAVDAGGNNHDPLNGLTARATFQQTGTHLRILLENTSVGVPSSFDTASSLLVSLGFNLPDGVVITSGNSAVIGPGSHGLGAWSARGAGASVAEQWIWTNDFGGDLMNEGEALATAQVISTSNGQGGGSKLHFIGGSGNVNGPFGGIAANPVLRAVPNNREAVSNSIVFDLTLSGELSQTELELVAFGGVIEYGSDQRYLISHTIPAPNSLFIGAVGVAALLLRRGRA